MDMTELLASIEKMLAVATWRRLDAPPGAPASVLQIERYVGEHGDWHVSVHSFSIEDQGFAPGARGAEALAIHRSNGYVVRLPRPLAETALRAALAARVH